jgi:hypothetical protein
MILNKSELLIIYIYIFTIPKPAMALIYHFDPLYR